MADSMLNIEDMEIVLDEGTPQVVLEEYLDVTMLEDDIFDSLIVHEIETPTIETKIEVPTGESEIEKVAIVYNLEGNTIQSHEDCSEVNLTLTDTKSTLQTKNTKSDNTDDNNMVVEGPRSRQIGKIPIALRGLIGQAKMFLLKKNYNMAIKICVNILKECPNASEPFFTLSDIYEQMGDTKKCLETAVIGSSLSSVTSEDWVILGETCESNNMLPLTDFCLTKAIQKDKRNLDLHIKRASILEQLGTAKSAMNEYDRLLRKLRPDQKDSIITLSKLLVHNFVKDKNYDRASNILIHVFSLFPTEIQPEQFVKCLDYLIINKNYKKCLELLVEHYNVEFAADINDESSITDIIECVVPSTTPILVRVKLIEILIQLKAFSILPPIYTPILNMTQVNQFHLNIADALFKYNQFNQAISFLEKLINSENEIFDQQTLKIKYSECLKSLGLLEQAVDSYRKLLKVNPHQLTVKFDLYMSLRKLNRIDESLEVLFQDDMENRDCRLLYEYALATLNKDDMFDKCLKVANLMFSRHCVPVCSLREVKSMMAIHKIESRHDTLLTIKQELYGYRQENILTINPIPSANEEWNLMHNICLKFIEKNLYYEGLKMLLSAMNSAVLAPFNQQIVLNAIKFAFKVRTYKLSFILSRYLLFKYPQAPQIANLFCFLLNKCAIKKQAKFIFRLAAKYPDNIALNLLDTNVFNDTYNYQLKFARYTELLNKLEDKSQLYFMLGVLILRLCTFKVGADRHSLTLQGIGFLMNYKEHRGIQHEQECYYNIARAYHQVGMAAKALHYYKLVLETKPFSEEYCLKHAAAYNLHLIYMNSGNLAVALMYINLVQV
ncbi:Tetratricopeptide repeat,Tetratricopeptide repeat-containing domain,Tetratricopeptide-like helical [Cinara cedri]|uniref:Tetratricopeptide repeat,Tetratricopeptide repeat-containing domain,Tetratricopeptide-like helical n=1 Tax=Cinara cedri TaxID=506608 RepID=A0A5E4MKV3_9HEMI|nr:Tetratricopeptide repeat,Tetratricopeptide repeat-containing domain,Tetratricopeptide-like helical [Cinara cedri]